jgi:hypothetical protein
VTYADGGPTEGGISSPGGKDMHLLGTEQGVESCWDLIPRVPRVTGFDPKIWIHGGSSSNPGIRDLLKKVKINYSLFLPTFTSKRELHVWGVLKNKLIIIIFLST